MNEWTLLIFLATHFYVHVIVIDKKTNVPLTHIVGIWLFFRASSFLANVYDWKLYIQYIHKTIAFTVTERCCVSFIVILICQTGSLPD